MAPPGRTRQLVAVGVGGAIGGTARYLLTEIFPEPPGAFPLTTLAINVTGAFLLPLAVTVIAAALAAPTLIRLLVTTGILSSFTTFSAVVYATDSLIRDGATAAAIWYPLLTVGLGLLAALVGWGLGHRIALKIPPMRAT